MRKKIQDLFYQREDGAIMLGDQVIYQQKFFKCKGREPILLTFVEDCVGFL